MFLILPLQNEEDKDNASPFLCSPNDTLGVGWREINRTLITPLLQICCTLAYLTHSKISYIYIFCLHFLFTTMQWTRLRRRDGLTIKTHFWLDLGIGSWSFTGKSEGRIFDADLRIPHHTSEQDSLGVHTTINRIKSLSKWWYLIILLITVVNL